jgi:hypothetical protein
MFQNMAGIQPLDAAFKTFMIKPEIADSGIHYVNADYHSMYGKISSSWKKKGQQVMQSVRIPVNTRAEVYIPAAIDFIKYKGNPLRDRSDISAGSDESGNTKLLLGSGFYEFVILKKNMHPDHKHVLSSLRDDPHRPKKP